MKSKHRWVFYNNVNDKYRKELIKALKEDKDTDFTIWWYNNKGKREEYNGDEFLEVYKEIDKNLKNASKNIHLGVEKAYAKNIVKLLKKRYGKEPICHLNYKKDYEFLFAVMMSAQTTDKKVNSVTPLLFKKYKSLKDFKNANVKDIENIIKEIGLYKTKAKNLKLCATKLLDEYGGKIPKDHAALVNLPGVGNKTANVVLGNIFKVPAMAVDTHVNRVSNKLFNLNEKDPNKVEKKLKEIIDKKDYVLWNTHIIALGREYCKARNPKCEECIMGDNCMYNFKKHNVENE